MVVVVQVSVGERRCDLSNLQNLLHAQPTVYKTLKGREEKKNKKEYQVSCYFGCIPCQRPSNKM